MPTLSRSIVNDYIETARLRAHSLSEVVAVAEALEITQLPFGPDTYQAALTGAVISDTSRRLKGHGGGGGEGRDRVKRRGGPHVKASARKDVVAWKKLILKQLHIALCTRSSKYAKEVAALKLNAKLLIAAVAGYVAASVGVAVAVIAALVAAILRLVLKIGIAAFCEQGEL